MMVEMQEHKEPKLRFPEFNRGWERLAIGKFIKEFREKSTVQDQYEVLTSARAGLIRQKDYYENERITDRDNIGFNVLPPGYMTYRSRSDDRRFFFNENNLGITGIVSIYYPVFKIVDGDIGFFKNLMSVKEHYIGKFSVGTSQTVLSLKQLSEIRLHFPVSPEQKKIAAFLGAVDEKLNGLRRKRDLLSDYKRGVMQQIFSQHIRFKRDDGSDFPDWKEMPLREVFDERSQRGNGNAPLLSVTVSRGILHSDEVERANSASYDRSNYKTVCSGDIAYNSMRMWQGASGVSTLNGIVSPAYTVLKPRKNQIPKFWGYTFKLKKSIQLFQRFSQGLTSDTWNLKYPTLSLIRIKAPCEDEQRKIAEFLSALDAKIDAVADQIIQIETFKQGLLQQMFV